MPADERFGLSQQLRTATVSVAGNIAEGSGRLHTRELIRFLGIANGSLREVDTHLALAIRLGYVTDETASECLRLVGETGRLLVLLIRSLRRRLGSKPRAR